MNRALLSALLLLVTRPLLAAPEGTVELELLLEPRDLSLEALPDGRLQAALPGYPAAGDPGDVRLPTRVLRLALPPGLDLGALTLEVEDLSPPVWVPLVGELARAEGPRVLCPTAGCGRAFTRPAGPRLAGQTAWLTGTGRLGPVVLAELVHRPLGLSPDGRGLLLHPRQRLRLRAPRVGPGQAVVPGPASLRLVDQAARLVANPRDLARFHPAPRDLLPDAHGVAVVAPEWLVQASQALPAYLAGLEQRGFTVTLVTDAELAGEAGEPPDGLPQKLRAWLQRSREPLGLVYLVLLGNPDPRHGDLPMQNTHPYQPGAVDYVEEIPTDAYYADLSGDWDLDGDGRFGEWDGDRGPGGVDFYPELLVGRIPVYGDAAMADRLLARATAYPRPSPDSGWRRSLLLPASILFYRDIPSGSTRIDGADLAVPVKLEFEAAGFEALTLVEREGVQPSFRPADLELTEEQVLRTWREGYGLVLWIGHGSDDAAYRTLWVEDADGDLNASPWEQASVPFAQAIHHDQLPAERPAFVFHGSCSNGVPENAANIAYTQLKTGAIASYASSRVALGTVANPWSPDPSSCEIMMAGYYVVAGLRDGQPAGQAWADARALLSDAWWGEACWHTKLATVLY
ncbi:MAG TPA: C25 family cysteine peptidase, partial [Myxococcota bacterium]|nr:C25 family cysteine peptidase [Myxococcota bacterium]